MALPAAAASIVIAEPIIATLFQRGAFTAGRHGATAAALIAYSIGPAGLCADQGAGAGFLRPRRHQDARCASRSDCVLVNFAAQPRRSDWARRSPISASRSSTAIAAWVNTTLLAVTLHRRNYFAADARLKSKVPRMVIASLGMAAVLWIGQRLLAAPLADGEAARAVALAVLVAAGLVGFGVLALLTRAADWADVKARLRPRPPSRRRASP